MSNMFSELKAGLQEALDHAEGRPIPGQIRTLQVSRTDILAARLNIGLTQKQFASVIGASVETLRKWEQGTRAPSGAASRLIQIIQHRPTIIEEALGITPVAAQRRARSMARA